MKNCTKRESNFELLRIVAIFMIILYHIQSYGGAKSIAGK